MLGSLLPARSGGRSLDLGTARVTAARRGTVTALLQPRGAARTRAAAGRRVRIGVLLGDRVLVTRQLRIARR